MVKRLIILVMILSFTLIGLSACNNAANLTNYKSQAKAELDAYAVQSDYSEANWQVVLEIIAEGKTAIEAAKNKPAVNAAISTAKTAIDTVEEKEDGEEMNTKYDFKDDRIIVILKQKVDGILTPEDFGIDWEKAGLGKITDITRNEDYVGGCPFQKLSIELSVNGIDKIFEAIAELEKSEIVQFVEPDYNYVISQPYPYEVEVEPIKE